jgi:putative ABC transport system permease protein
LRAGRLFEPVDDAPGSAVIISETMARRFWPDARLAVFAAAAMVLAAIGIVGVATNAVSRRTRELAIRMAVGAAPRAAMRLVMSGTLLTAVGGAATGVALALAVTRSLRPSCSGSRRLIRSPMPPFPV